MEILYLLVISLSICIYLLMATNMNGFIKKFNKFIFTTFALFILVLMIFNVLYCITQQSTFDYSIDFYNWYVLLSYTLLTLWSIYLVDAVIRFNRYKYYFENHNLSPLINYESKFEEFLY